MTRLGFVIAQALGHVTYQQNLERHIASRGDVVARWLPIEAVMPDVWQRFLPFEARVGLRTRAAIRAAASSEPFEALCIHTESLAIGGLDLMRRTPTMISSDASPLDLRAMADAYGMKRRPHWYNQAFDAWTRKIYQAASFVTIPSEWAKCSIVDHYRVPESGIEVIPFGVDTDYWTPAPHVREDDGVIRFLFVGGDFVRKGGDLLLRWAERTSAKGWEIHLVTRGEVRATRGVHVHRLSNNSEALVRLAQSCDAFVLPTRADCSAWAIIEAMAVGLPIITTTVGGCRELVAEGETGYLMPPDDFDGLNDRLLQLMASRTLRLALGQAARRRAVEHHDMNVNCRRIVDRLKSVALTR